MVIVVTIQLFAIRSGTKTSHGPPQEGNFYQTLRNLIKLISQCNLRSNAPKIVIIVTFNMNFYNSNTSKTTESTSLGSKQAHSFIHC